MITVANGLLEAGDFAAGRCRECRCDVLTYPDADPRSGQEARRCVHCDERLTGELRWIDVADLTALGYVIDSGREDAGGCVSCAGAGCATKSVDEGRGVQ